MEQRYHVEWQSTARMKKGGWQCTHSHYDDVDATSPEAAIEHAKRYAMDIHRDPRFTFRLHSFTAVLVSEHLRTNYVVHYTVRYQYPIRIRNHGPSTMKETAQLVTTLKAEGHTEAIEAARLLAGEQYRWVSEMGGSIEVTDVKAMTAADSIAAEVEAAKLDLAELVKEEKYEHAAALRDAINEATYTQPQ